MLTLRHENDEDLIMGKIVDLFNLQVLTSKTKDMCPFPGVDAFSKSFIKNVLFILLMLFYVLVMTCLYLILKPLLTLRKQCSSSVDSFSSETKQQSPLKSPKLQHSKAGLQLAPTSLFFVQDDSVSSSLDSKNKLNTPTNKERPRIRVLGILSSSPTNNNLEPMQPTKMVKLHEITPNQHQHQKPQSTIVPVSDEGLGSSNHPGMPGSRLSSNNRHQEKQHQPILKSSLRLVDSNSMIDEEETVRNEQHHHHTTTPTRLIFADRLVLCYVRVLMFGYKNISLFTIVSLNCVQVYGKPVLYISGDTECYRQPWQWFVVVFLVVWVVPFPIALVLAYRLFKRCLISRSSYAFCLTFPPVAFLLTYRARRTKRRFIDCRTACDFALRYELSDIFEKPYRTVNHRRHCQKQQCQDGSDGYRCGGNEEVTHNKVCYHYGNHL